MLIENQNKPFETPDSGQFIGTIIDVVDLGPIQTKFGTKTKIRIVWVLDKADASGQPFRVMKQVNATMNEKSALYDIAKSVFGQAPPVPFESESLLGRSNLLFIVRETAPDSKVYANIKGILPTPPGAACPTAPQGFIRAKDKVNNGVSNGAPAVKPAAAPAQAATKTADVTF